MEVTAPICEGLLQSVDQIRGMLTSVQKQQPFDPAAANALKERGEVVTGLLYVDPLATDLHIALNTTHRPLNTLGPAQLCPGAKALDRINAALR